jgi:hypothetical protein
MSKHWSAIEIITADTIWEFIDEQMQCLTVIEEGTSDDPAGTIYKLILRGRMEMLDTISKVLMNDTVMLGDILVAHGIINNEDLKEQ